ALALPWSSAAEHAELMRAAAHVAPLIAITRDGGEGRTSLTRARRVRIDYRLDAAGGAPLRPGLVSMARLLRAAGGARAAGRRAGGGGGPRGGRGAPAGLGGGVGGWDSGRMGAWFSRPPRGGGAGGGPGGGDHPADPRGRVRAADGRAVIGGLYVADGSTFPT